MREAHIARPNLRRARRARLVLALAALTLASLACQTVVIIGGPPAPTATPGPPVEPTYGPGVVTVEAVPPDGGPAGGEDLFIVTPAPTPEGPTLPRALYFLSDREGAAQVYLFAGDGTAANRITNEPEGIRGYALDPGGAFMVAHTDRRVLIISNQRILDTLEAGQGVSVRGFALAPGGARLAFWTEALLTVYEIGPAGPRFLRLADAAPTSAVWSADSRTLAYTAPDGVHLLDADTGRDILAFVASDDTPYRVDGASPDGRWILASTTDANGACLARLIPLPEAFTQRVAAQTLRCPLTFSPDGAYALWTPVDAATIQVTGLQAGALRDEGWRTTTVIADYAAYAPVWPYPERFFLWTCAFRGQACPPGALDLYAGAWPEGRLALWWDSGHFRVMPQAGGAAPADPAWETFAVVAEPRAGATTALLVVDVPAGTVNVVAEAGNNWAPQWFTLP